MNAKKIFIVLVSTAIFPWLFYEKSIGVNLLIFNLIIFVGLFFIGKLNIKNKLNRSIALGTLLSAIFVVYNGSALSIAVNIISLFLFAGSNIFDNGRNLFYASISSFINFFTSQINFFLSIRKIGSRTKKFKKVNKYLRLIIIPLIIVFVFVLIYKAANPVFEGMVKSFFDVIDNFFEWFFDNIEIALFMTFILGFIISNSFFMGSSEKSIVAMDKNSSDKLVRIRRKRITKFKTNALKSEYTSALILFISLNILILIINFIDIWWVWLNFEWDGEYLKQFVHEGTYLLILSIIISLAISIIYFRGNINFLKKNILLKKLAYLWLAQNAILTISVGIRNFWYINYFSLAYLRIGVIFFLILTLFSILTVFIKIKNKKTTYYLFRRNTLAAYVLLVVMAFFNWDVIIAKYNFSHSETAFVHFNFLADLSDNALPYLEKTDKELKEIDKIQKEKFPFRKRYISSSDYSEIIIDKKLDFLNEWKNRSWLEWNFAGEKAFRKISY